MKKTKLNFAILKYTSDTDRLIKIICSHNEGKKPVCLEDFISWAHIESILFPSLHGGLTIEKSDEPTELRVSNDGGKTWHMVINEIEVEELVMTESL